MTAASAGIDRDVLHPAGAGSGDGTGGRGIGQRPGAAEARHLCAPDMDKLTVISGCLFLAADIFAIASIANPDWISTGDSAGTFLVDWDTTLRVFRCGRREREREGS